MCKKGLTELVCLVDCSKSMKWIHDEAIEGFNRFLDRQRKTPGECRVTLAFFASDVDFVKEAVPIGEVPPLDDINYRHRRGTALLDAIGSALTRVEDRLRKTAFSERPEKVVFAILTDGIEFDSKEYARHEIYYMIMRRRAKYGWEFIYLAANQDSFAEADHLYIPQNASASFRPDREGMGPAWSAISEQVSMIRGFAGKDEKCA